MSATTSASGVGGRKADNLKTRTIARSRPSMEIETSLVSNGYCCIAGIDEVGRGPLAGPVVAAAAVLPDTLPNQWIHLVRDSKQLTPEQRDEVYAHLMDAVVDHGIGACDPSEIDALGIATATRLAMARAVEALDPCPDHLLLDAMKLPALTIPQMSIVKGDSISTSIAAASIIAKVTRDRLMMTVFEERYPDYGFAAHKGYGTAEHMTALRTYGPTPIHRASFAPIRELLGAVNSQR